MLIEPLKRITPRPYALLEPSHRRLLITTQDYTRPYSGRRSIETALDGLRGVTCYVLGRLVDLAHTTGATSWVLSTWKGRETRMTHLPSGVKVTSLRSTLDGDHEPFGSLTTVLDWLWTFGIAPASMSSMAWKLLRASLDGPVHLGVDPDVTTPAFYGPRQELREPGVHFGMMAVDMRAAYPSAMSSRPYALSLREVDASTALDPTVAGLAQASVRVPSFLGHPPLPVRVMDGAIQFRCGVISGTWPWCELRAAQDVGCDVTVERCYAPRREGDLFFPWWQLAQTGRALPPYAANLAKAIANSTWGQFGMTGTHRAEVHWVDDKATHAYTVDLDDRALPHRWGLHVAAETTARVRTRLLNEVLYANPNPPLHVDTDGVIVSDQSALPTDYGDGFGQWTVKTMMYEVDARAPQFYRYTCSDCGVEHAKWHVVASGIPATMAPDWFRKHAPRGTRIAFGGDVDAVLPACDAHDATRIAALLDEARLYGVGAT